MRRAGGSPYPDSMSTDTGTSTAAVICSTRVSSVVEGHALAGRPCRPNRPTGWLPTVSAGEALHPPRASPTRRPIPSAEHRVTGLMQGLQRVGALSRDLHRTFLQPPTSDVTRVTRNSMM